MKLEIENPPQNFFSQQQLPLEKSPEEIKSLLDEGIQAAKNGNRAEAHRLLSRVTETEPENETAWLWLASGSEYPEELLAFLRRVLEINPHNERALEWSAATRLLLAENFVQRGIEAAREDQQEFARQCFLQAAAHNPQNEFAFFELARLAESPEEKTEYLEQLLKINPANETAMSALGAVKQETAEALLKKANFAAISGERETAQQLLEEVMQSTPDHEEVWILRAYLAADSEEKIACYEKVLQLNPDNEAAQAGLFSLQSIIQKAVEQKPFADALKEAIEASDLSNLSNNSSLEAQILQSETKEQTEENQSLVAEDFAPIPFDNPTREAIEDFAENDEIILAEQYEIDADEIYESSTDAAFLIDLELESDVKTYPNQEFSSGENDRAVSAEAEELISETDDLPPENFELDIDLPDESTVSKEIAFDKTENFDAEVENQKTVENQTGKRTIMIVDGNPLIRKLVSGKLEKCGHAAVAAANGRDALAKIGEMTPDLILLDIAMPEMDGYQVCKIIRNGQETKDVPVLMISGKDGVFDEARGKMAGSTGFITKPFGPETLMRAIENYLS